VSFGALPVPLVIGLQFVWLPLIGVVLGRSPARRALAWAMVFAGLALPFAMVDVPIMRAFSGLFAMFGPMRTLELSQRSTMPPVGFRVLTYLLPLDARTLRRAPSTFDKASVAPLLAHAALGLAGVAIVWLAGPMGAGGIALRLVGCLLALYGIVDSAAASLRLSLALVGFDTKPMQIHPVLAESAGDFWGRRWNRVVSDWLRYCCFLPVARRWGPRWGALAAFAASGALHYFPALVALSGWPALACGGYFIVEALIVVVETRMRVPLWPRALRHAWAALAVVGPSPLFLVPILEIFGAWR
jgi:hypothetical protein